MPAIPLPATPKSNTSAIHSRVMAVLGWAVLAMSGLLDGSICSRTARRQPGSTGDGRGLAPAAVVIGAIGLAASALLLAVMRWPGHPVSLNLPAAR